MEGTASVEYAVVDVLVAAVDAGSAKPIVMFSCRSSSLWLRPHDQMSRRLGRQIPQQTAAVVVDEMARGAVSLSSLS